MGLARDLTDLDDRLREIGLDPFRVANFEKIQEAQPILVRLQELGFPDSTRTLRV